MADAVARIGVSGGPSVPLRGGEYSPAMQREGVVEAGGPAPARPPSSFAALYALSLSLSMGYGMVFSLIAEFRDRFGFTEAQTGLIVGAGFLSGFLAQVFLSRLADRGYGNHLLRLGAISACAAMVWMSTADSLAHFVLARLLLGAGAGAVVPTARRVVMTTSGRSRGEALGRLAAFDLVGFVIGPLVAAVFLAWGGFRWPFVAMAAVYAVVAAISFTVDASVAPRPAQPGVVRALLRRARFRRSLGIGFAFYTTIGTFEATWALLYADLGAEQWLTSVTLSLFVIPMALLATTGGRTAERVGVLPVTRVSIAVAMVCMLLYGLVGATGEGDELQLWAVAITTVLAALHSVADAYTMPSMQLAVADASPDELLATGQGVLSAFGLLVALSATIVASALYEVAGTFAAFAVPTAAMAVGLAYSQWPVAAVDSSETTGEPAGQS